MIALLCIQEDPDLRPPASRVSVMLSTKEVEIPTAPVQLPLELNNVYYSTLPTMSRTIIGHSFPSSQIDFSIQELEIATNGFQCKLGEGRFGSVSKGILANGRQVVVKKARKETTGFMNELKSIAKLHHRNILELVGFCSESEELMLVYDYMPNGTLSDFLFDPIKKQVLDWRRRFNVILEVISALAYLYERAGADKRIVHRDIKPANILLDENFSARISDFTLAVALQNNMDESTPLAGTLGYIAPECIVGGHLTEKADIYSFGILVLNVVSGKTCLEFTSLDDGLHNLVEREENGFIELIDPELVKDPGFDSGDILRAIIIALLCLQIDPDLRPPASQVLVMLSTKEMEIPTAPDNVHYAIPQELNNVYYLIPSSAIQHFSEFDCRDDIFRG
uniref:Protein kinase domain-containing protein n=1 Tax=Araucaria cunninghamii TaxID=56994 RepID=A0A0D6QUJ2_ARACU